MSEVKGSALRSVLPVLHSIDLPAVINLACLSEGK